MGKAGVMPRETVFSDSTSEFVVSVGWRPDGYVQVATEMLGTVETVWQRVDGLFAAASDDAASAHHFRGWHATLNRSELNKLIRLLRKARDSAYGQDA